jgi:hypothetical protein
MSTPSSIGMASRATISGARDSKKYRCRARLGRQNSWQPTKMHLRAIPFRSAGPMYCLDRCALAVSYYGSLEYQKMSSKSVRRNIIEKFLREIDANGLSSGDKRAAMLRKEHVVAFIAAPVLTSPRAPTACARRFAL